ncbi:hypothetical protein Arth_1354 [Arthrobacter sp. FB24]|uniref:hypothetical protein n=1 Tax=Arthrobacter sp. (strain FB24) TaxID=290399 RepID=UPI0000526D8A|nr:hypothetical protein [Arthrobacter sp. FB24]ABK02748.1 hypothetical protein Arth_1354 [Arthrobacter sp. FB24]
MALFSKTIEQAHAAVTKAGSVVVEWEEKASAARAEAIRLDTESGAAILEDESAAERITLNIQANERRARAFDQAAEEARRKHATAYREALEVEAREEEKQAASATKEATAHRAKVAALVNQLNELEDADYRPTGVYVGTSGINLALPRSERLDKAAKEHHTRAALIRYFIKSGTITHDIHVLNAELGTSIQDNGLTIPGEGIEIPQSLTAARDAGVYFVGA